MNEDYRKRIYQDYGTNFQDAPDMLSTKKIIRWKKGYKYYFKNWLPDNKNAFIVEIACGNGRMLDLLKDLGYTNITGVDISPEQVQLAKKFCKNVEQANALDWLESHPNCCDLIICMDMIEHLYKDEVLRFLDSCNKALKPGGKLILQTVNGDSFWGASARYHDFTHELSFGYNSLTRLLNITGFKSAQGRECGPIPYGYSIKSSIRFLLWQVIRIGLIVWNFAETGFSKNNIFTRAFLIKADKE
jgi:2-polyprenyl-3-methyl-5-hydroxy-6-metoxy-1,4-benzoquinol methylase